MDKPKNDERDAYEAQKECEIREALERFYGRTGQVKPDLPQQAIAELAHRIEQMPPGVMTFEDIEVPLTIAGRKAVLRAVAVEAGQALHDGVEPERTQHFVTVAGKR